MKRPLCLVGTTLLASMATGLAAAAAAVAVAPPPNEDVSRATQGGGHPRADEPPHQRRTPHPLSAGEERFIVPVPPAIDDDDDESSSLPVIPDHRPHPSYLDQHRALDFAMPFGRHSEGEGEVGNNGKGDSRQRKAYHSTSGPFKNLVLLLRFSDHDHRTLPSKSDISRLYNSEDFDFDPSLPLVPRSRNGSGDSAEDDGVAPTGSVRQVYLANSRGSFRVKTTVVDWISLPETEAHYAAGNHGFSRFKEAIIDALDSLDMFSALGGVGGGFGVDFDDFDLDENGALDGLGVLHSGYGAEFGGTDCEGAENEDRIWSHKGGLQWTSSPDDDGDGDGGRGVKVNRYYVSSALRGKCNSNIVRMGVICHEIGHYLGLPDLYDSTFEGTGLGAYDFMSQSWGWDGTGQYPPTLSAWSRMETGWADIVEIDADGEYELVAGGGQEYKISVGFPDGEYLLLENRQPVGYDTKMGTGGIAIYHVDEGAVGQERRGYPEVPSNGWPENGDHYRVALLSADGKYDLERGVNQGDEGDLWHSGSAMTELGPGGDGGVFPNTDAYRDGKVVSTGIRIFDFSDSGNVMTFKVEGVGSGSVGAVISLAEIFGSGSKTPEPTLSPTAEPTSNPTGLPTKSPMLQPTANPTNVPTEPPTLQPTPKPATSAPSEEPTLSPVTSPPTLSPAIASNATAVDVEVDDPCGHMCLMAIQPGECPSVLHELPECADITAGELCDADGECGTDQKLNNCATYDVYRRVDCRAGPPPGGADVVPGTEVVDTAALDDGVGFAGTVNITAATATTSNVESNNTVVDLSVDSIPHEQNVTLDGMTNWNTPGVLSQPEDTIAPVVTLTGSPTGSLSAAPVFGVGISPGLGPEILNAEGSSAKGFALGTDNTGGNDESDADCPYYPGWSVGLPHCLRHCDPPSYMISNSNFEFDTPEECCERHYGSRASCVMPVDVEPGGSDAVSSASDIASSSGNDNGYELVIDNNLAPSDPVKLSVILTGSPTRQPSLSPMVAPTRAPSHDLTFPVPGDSDASSSTSGFGSSGGNGNGYELVVDNETAPSNPAELSAILTGSPTRQPSMPPVGAPTRAPSDDLTLPVGAKPGSDAGSSASGFASSGIDDAPCPYYPGWNIGLPYCLRDCRQPQYMVSSKNFEFDSLDACCSLHYQGSLSCRIKSLMELEKSDSAASGLPSIGGRVWKDGNGNGWQDYSETAIGSGVSGALVDLYECPPNTPSSTPVSDIRFARWSQGTRTSADGMYLLLNIPSGKWYYVQVTPPGGYQLPEGHPWNREIDLFDEDGRSKCMELASGRESVTLKLGLIPNGLAGTSNYELVSAAADIEQVDQGEDTLEEEQYQQVEDEVDTASYAAMHAKSPTSITGDRKNDARQIISIPTSPPSEYTTLHTKTYLRGSGFASTSSTPSSMVVLQPTDDATIHSNEGMKYLGGIEELRVGPESSWRNDILLKFDITPFIAMSPGSSDYKVGRKAVLRLHSLVSSPTGGIVYLGLGDDSWGEGDVTWSTAPVAGETLAIIGQTRPNSWVEVNITGMLSAAQGSSSGLVTLRIASEASNHSWLAKYSSKENMEGHPAPELLVFF